MASVNVAQLIIDIAPILYLTSSRLYKQNECRREPIFHEADDIDSPYILCSKLYMMAPRSSHFTTWTPSDKTVNDNFCLFILNPG